MKRPYQQKRRAEAQTETRQRIVEATIELHQSQGLAATSVSDIARRAKVGKVTVYRHFPDEAALVNACSGLYFERHPFPDIEPWLPIQDPGERLRRGLADAYAYHRATEPMLSRVLPEARDHPVMEPYHAYWGSAVEALAAAWPTAGREAARLKAGLALALSFDTWRLLTSVEGLSDAEAIDLMARLTPSVTGRPANVSPAC